MFTMVNLARHLGINPDTALQDANDKFERRFRAMELAIRADGTQVERLNTETLETYWRSAKKITSQRSDGNKP